MQKINPADPKIEQNTLKEKLMALCPEIFIEGKINFDALQTLLPDELEDEEATREHFGLNWTGKTQARRLALTRPRGSTLRPALGEGINEETTQNVFIEGDNLEVLKILREAYSDQVKMIYIDPPYNTGKDFIYKDDFSETIDDYLNRTQQKDGNTLLVANPKASGRYHSNWLNFIYPRLRIARELLTEDGVIFVSIDVNEVHNLRQVMNEIYGEETFLGEIVRATGQTTGQDSGGLGSSFDYILAYSKKVDYEIQGLALTEDDLKRFENEDEDGNKFAYDQMRKTGSSDLREDRPRMYYGVKDPDGNIVFPIGPTGYESRWRFEEKTYLRLVDENFIIWRKTKKNNEEVWWPYVKYYLEGRTKRPSPLWNDLDGNKKASRDLRELFDGKKLFDFPKPTQLIERLLQVSTNANDGSLIMDFFAGSATTAHAVMNMNDSDKGNRRYVCVQLPEECNEKTEAFKNGYKNISQLSQERIKRVIDKISQEKEKTQNELFPSTKHQNLDLGFKVFKLDESNLSVWQNFKGADTAQLSLAFQKQTENPLKEGWQKEALRVEMMLLEGFPLHSRQEKVVAFTKNEIWKITSDFNHNALYICLDLILEDSTVNALLLETDDIFICLDEALTDLQKTNLDDKLKLKTI